MQLYAAQTEPLREALRRDENGLFVYSLVLWGAIKKSAKSSIAAAVGLGFAWSRPNANIVVMGNDLKQAQSRVFEYMTRAISLHPQWRETCKVNLYDIYLPNGSHIEAIPIDPSGEAGGNPDLAIYTELWGWKNIKAQQMWTESTLSPTKYGQSLRWCESYAGYEGESVVLERLYQQAVKQGECISEQYEMYRNTVARLFALWTTKPSLPWQTPEYYAQEDAILTPEEFLRVHRNTWGTSSNPFVPYVWWETCAGDVPKTATVVVALDAAVSGDCFAMVAVSHWQKQVNDELIPAIAIQAVHVIEPPLNGKIDYDEARAKLKEWSQLWRITVVPYDEYQLHDFATQAQKEMSLNFQVFKQGEDRLIADKQLYDLIRDGRVAHNNIADLNDHIRNAARKEQGDNKLRIVKKNENRKIDAVVALSMAAWHGIIPPPSYQIYRMA